MKIKKEMVKFNGEKKRKWREKRKKCHLIARKKEKSGQKKKRVRKAHKMHTFDVLMKVNS